MGKADHVQNGRFQGVVASGIRDVAHDGGGWTGWDVHLDCVRILTRDPVSARLESWGGGRGHGGE